MVPPRPAWRKKCKPGSGSRPSFRYFSFLVWLDSIIHSLSLSSLRMPVAASRTQACGIGRKCDAEQASGSRACRRLQAAAEARAQQAVVDVQAGEAAAETRIAETKKVAQKVGGWLPSALCTTSPQEKIPNARLACLAPLRSAFSAAFERVHGWVGVHETHPRHFGGARGPCKSPGWYLHGRIWCKDNFQCTRRAHRAVTSIPVAAGNT